MNNYTQEFIDVLKEINDEISTDLLSANNDEMLNIEAEKDGFVSFNYESNETRTKIIDITPTIILI